MNLRTNDGGIPSPTKQYKQLMFMVIEDDKPVMMQLKVCYTLFLHHILIG
jgi:hypothetical protein